VWAMKLSADGVTFLSGRNCDFSIEEGHRFAGRSTTWAGDGSGAQTFTRVGDRRSTTYGACIGNEVTTDFAKRHGCCMALRVAGWPPLARQPLPMGGYLLPPEPRVRRLRQQKTVAFDQRSHVVGPGRCWRRLRQIKMLPPLRGGLLRDLPPLPRGQISRPGGAAQTSKLLGR
jgi:hypothetical protein